MDESAAAGGDIDGSAEDFSVALCTYNGARYLGEQLASIFAARPRCSELVLVDDASRDETLAVASQSIAAWRGRAVVDVNPVNAGSLRSFERALRLTTRKYVFLADQDDVWHDAKVPRMLGEFARRPELLLLHSDARVVDDLRRPHGYTLFGALLMTSGERRAIHDGRAFESFIRRNLATGATIAFRRTLLDAALPIPDEWVHDEWLATIASAIGVVDFIDETLIDYRQHANNQIGAKRLTFAKKVEKAFNKPDDYYQRHLRRTTALLGRLVELGPLVAPEHVLAVLGKLKHLQVRATLPANRIFRVWPIVSELLSGAYRRYSTGFNSVARDLLHRR